MLVTDEIEALPVADDKTYPALLPLRATSPKYVGEIHTLAPLLSMQFARAVIPDEALQK